MDIKGVFFDLYGTLLKYGDIEAGWAAWLDSFHRILAEGGVVIGCEGLKKACQGLFAESEPPALDDGFTVYERRLSRFLERQSLCCNTELVKRAATETVNAWNRHVSLDPHALSVIEALQAHFRLALVSNFDHPPHVYSVLKQTGLDACFGTVVISGEVGVKKPDPAILLLAAQSVGLKPEEIAYVGDSLEDMQAARNASMFGIWIENGSQAAEAAVHYERKTPLPPAGEDYPRNLARAIIRDLREIPALLGLQ